VLRINRKIELIGLVGIDRRRRRWRTDRTEKPISDKAET